MKAAPIPFGLSKAVADVCRDHPVELAYLFGSTAHGMADRESDLDIAVLTAQSLPAD